MGGSQPALPDSTCLARGLVVEVNVVFSIRNLGGVALFLFGTTYLWLTPMFASRGIPTRGIWWSVTQILAFATLLGFTVAAWGLFKKSSWWDGLAIGSAGFGFVCV